MILKFLKKDFRERDRYLLIITTAKAQETDTITRGRDSSGFLNGYLNFK